MDYSKTAGQCQSVRKDATIAGESAMAAELAKMTEASLMVAAGVLHRLTGREIGADAASAEPPTSPGLTGSLEAYHRAISRNVSLLDGALREINSAVS